MVGFPQLFLEAFLYQEGHISVILTHQFVFFLLLYAMYLSPLSQCIYRVYVLSFIFFIYLLKFFPILFYLSFHYYM